MQSTTVHAETDGSRKKVHLKLHLDNFCLTGLSGTKKIKHLRFIPVLTQHTHAHPLTHHTHHRHTCQLMRDCTRLHLKLDPTNLQCEIRERSVLKGHNRRFIIPLFIPYSFIHSFIQPFLISSGLAKKGLAPGRKKIPGGLNFLISKANSLAVINLSVCLTKLLTSPALPLTRQLVLCKPVPFL